MSQKNKQTIVPKSKTAWAIGIVIFVLAVYAIYWNTFVFLKKHREFADFDTFVVQHLGALSLQDLNDEMESILAYHPEIGNDEVLAFKFYPLVNQFLTTVNPPDVPEVRRTFAILEKYTPNNAEILINTAKLYELGWLLWHQQKDYDTALNYYKRVDALKPHDLNTLSGLYCLYNSRGDAQDRDQIGQSIEQSYSFVHIQSSSCK